MDITDISLKMDGQIVTPWHSSGELGLSYTLGYPYELTLTVKGDKPAGKWIQAKHQEEVILKRRFKFCLHFSRPLPMNDYPGVRVSKIADAVLVDVAPLQPGNFLAVLLRGTPQFLLDGEDVDYGDTPMDETLRLNRDDDMYRLSLGQY